MNYVNEVGNGAVCRGIETPAHLSDELPQDTLGLIGRATRSYAAIHGGRAVGAANDVGTSIAVQLGKSHLAGGIKTWDWRTLGVDYLGVRVDFAPAL